MVLKHIGSHTNSNTGPHINLKFHNIVGSLSQIAHLICQIFLGDFNDVQLGVEPIPLEGHLILCQLLQDEQQQLIVVTLEGEVARECL